MTNVPQAYRRLLGTYLVLGVLLWTTPLLSILHVESSAVVATAAFFGAGWSTRVLLREGYGLRRIIVMQEAALLIPWLLLTLSLLWRPNCGYAQGLLLYLLFPGLTVIFAVALMRFLSALRVRRPVPVLFVVGILLVLIPPVYDLGFHPQFYSYNHVFGGFLGPIYDEELALRPGLFAFRTLTLLWTCLFIFASSWLKRRSSLIPIVVPAAAIVVFYVFAPQLGIITTHAQIRAELGTLRQTKNFDIYFDPNVVSEHDVDLIAADHEYRYAELARSLSVTVDERIQSYIYPDPDTKSRLTGARYTNVAPVWLNRPQTHVLLATVERVFPHELAHVFSREFALPVIRASVSIGLVEGLAVALEPPSGAPGPHDQVSAALLSQRVEAGAGFDGARDLSAALASHLSPLGFWRGRGAVSYTTMGSFVRFLMDEYGAERFKQVYAWADFDEVYGKSVDVLADEWTREILSLEAVNRSAQKLVAGRFRIPSLFEKDCPHYVPRYRRKYQDATTALIRGDSARAQRLLEESLEVRGDYLPAVEAWSGLVLARGGARDVLDRLSEVADDTTSAPLLIRFGDAHALLGDGRTARGYYERARRRLPSYAHEVRSLVLLREAVADEPAPLRAYLSGVERREHESIPEGGQAADRPRPSAARPAGRMLAAVRSARDGRFEQAVELLRTTSARDLIDAVPLLGGELERRRLVWLARYTYRAGVLPDAAVFADSAAGEYRAVGAFDEAAAQRDFHQKILWLLAQDTDHIALEMGSPARPPLRTESGNTWRRSDMRK